METKQKYKQRPKSADRSVMQIPKRQFMINFFYKQHTNHCRNIKYLHCSNKRKSQILSDQADHHSKVTDQQIIIRGKSAVFESTSRSSNASLRKISSYNKSFHRKNKSYSQGQLLNKQEKDVTRSVSPKKTHRNFLQKQKSINSINDDNWGISKQMVARFFFKTKTVLKQQQKAQKTQRIQNIYSCKFKALNKKIAKAPMPITDTYTPWQKNTPQIGQGLSHQLDQIK